MLNLADTAGIRETEDTIEKIGVEKSKAIMENAELIIFMADGIIEEDGSPEDVFDNGKRCCSCNSINGKCRFCHRFKSNKHKHSCSNCRIGNIVTYTAKHLLNHNYGNCTAKRRHP